jgi:phage tail sheath protein FI
MSMADIVVRAKVTSSTPVRGASEGQIGVVGIVKKPTGDIIKVTNFDEAQEKLGGYMVESTVMYGLKKIFNKLGSATVYVSPVTHRTDQADDTTEVGKKATVTLKDGAATPADLIMAEVNYFGKEGEKYAIEISEVDSTANTYTVAIVYNGVKGAPIKGVTNSTFLNRVSHKDITFTALTNDDTKLPVAGTFAFANAADAHIGVIAADVDRAIEALKTKPLDFLIVDSTLLSNQQTAASVAKNLKAVAYLNTPLGMTDEEAIEYRANFNSENARLLHPHQWEDDPLGNANNPRRAVPIAYEAVANQIIAFKEVGRRQVSAGMIYGSLTGLGLTHVPDADLLADTGVNCATVFEAVDGQNGGTFIWDATTLSNDPDWADLNRVQLFNYVYKSLVPSLRPSLFKASDPELWGKTEGSAAIFMENLYKKGELYGKSADEAYFVQCNEANNPREEQLAKRMHVKVGYKDKQMVKWIVLEIEVS